MPSQWADRVIGPLADVWDTIPEPPKREISRNMIPLESNRWHGTLPGEIIDETRHRPDAVLDEGSGRWSDEEDESHEGPPREGGPVRLEDLPEDLQRQELRRMPDPWLPERMHRDGGGETRVPPGFYFDSPADQAPDLAGSYPVKPQWQPIREGEEGPSIRNHTPTWGDRLSDAASRYLGVGDLKGRMADSAVATLPLSMTFMPGGIMRGMSLDRLDYMPPSWMNSRNKLPDLMADIQAGKGTGPMPLGERNNGAAGLAEHLAFEPRESVEPTMNLVNQLYGYGRSSPAAADEVAQAMNAFTRNRPWLTDPHYHRLGWDTGHGYAPVGWRGRGVDPYAGGYRRYNRYRDPYDEFRDPIDSIPGFLRMVRDANIMGVGAGTAGMAVHALWPEGDEYNKPDREDRYGPLPSEDEGKAFKWRKITTPGVGPQGARRNAKYGPLPDYADEGQAFAGTGKGNPVPHKIGEDVPERENWTPEMFTNAFHQKGVEEHNKASPIGDALSTLGFGWAPRIAMKLFSHGEDIPRSLKYPANIWGILASLVAAGDAAGFGPHSQAAQRLFKAQQDWPNLSGRDYKSEVPKIGEGEPPHADGGAAGMLDRNYS